MSHMPSTDEVPAIRAADLQKMYDSEVALDGLSLTIPAGTVYGFLGRLC